MSLKLKDRFDTPQIFSKWMKSNIHYKNYDKLMSAQEVYETKCGSCHDQVMFEKEVFHQMGYKTGTIFFIEVNDDGQGGKTHTLLYYKEKDKIYWFENAWGDESGIHGPYDSVKELKAYLTELHSKDSSSKKFPKIEFSTMKNVNVGDSLQKYVDSCLESAYMDYDNTIDLTSVFEESFDIIEINEEEDKELEKMMQDAMDETSPEEIVLEKSIASDLLYKTIRFQLSRPMKVLFDYAVVSKIEIKKKIKKVKTKKEIDDLIVELTKMRKKMESALNWRIKHGNIISPVDKTAKKIIKNNFLTFLDKEIDNLKNKTPVEESYLLESDLTDSHFKDRMIDNPDGDGKIVTLLEGENPYQVKELIKIFDQIGIENIYFGSDYHISLFTKDDIDRTNLILQGINRVVRPEDYFVIVGDLNSKDVGNIKDTKEFVSKIKCKNIYLIFGNNDKFDMDDYKKMGFKTITDKVIYKDYIITHFPSNVQDNQINIHGHIHGSREYLGDMNPKNHIDVWCGASNFEPKKLKEYIKLMNIGFYEG